MFLTDNFYN